MVPLLVRASFCVSLCSILLGPGWVQDHLLLLESLCAPTPKLSILGILMSTIWSLLLSPLGCFPPRTGACGRLASLCCTLLWLTLVVGATALFLDTASRYIGFALEARSQTHPSLTKWGHLCLFPVSLLILCSMTKWSRLRQTGAHIPDLHTRV